MLECFLIDVFLRKSNNKTWKLFKDLCGNSLWDMRMNKNCSMEDICESKFIKYSLKVYEQWW